MEWRMKSPGRGRRGREKGGSVPRQILPPSQMSLRYQMRWETLLLIWSVLKPNTSHGTIKKKGGCDATADVLIYIHPSIMKTFPSQFGNQFRFLQLPVAAQTVFEFVYAGKLPSDRVESSGIMWERPLWELFSEFLMQPGVTMLCPGKHGKGARETSHCLFQGMMLSVG